MSLEDNLKSILKSQNLFAAEKKVALVKAIAEAKCQVSPKRLRKLGDELAEQKRQKCVNRKTAELWWTFLRQKEPVQVGNLTVKFEGEEIKIEKSGGA